MWYYVAPEISPELRKMGEAALKAFGAKSRFFHLEFFRLKTAKPSLGNAGDILGLEVNMRPAGGYTVDMLNYAGGLDLYRFGRYGGIRRCAPSAGALPPLLLLCGPPR